MGTLHSLSINLLYRYGSRARNKKDREYAVSISYIGMVGGVQNAKRKVQSAECRVVGLGVCIVPIKEPSPD